MDFKGNYRIEAVYFEKLKRNIAEVKRLLEAGATDDARALLENAIDVDGAVLLLYRNLGELWADLADKLEETKKALQDLADKTEKYHDELNEKIDEINNYLMSLIRALDERLTAVEQDLATMQRVKILDLVNSPTKGDYLTYKGEELSAEEFYNMMYFPHLVIINIPETRTSFFYFRDVETIGTDTAYHFDQINLDPTRVSQRVITIHLQNPSPGTFIYGITSIDDLTYKAFDFYIADPNFDGDGYTTVYYYGSQSPVDPYDILTNAELGTVPVIIFPSLGNKMLILHLNVMSENGLYFKGNFYSYDTNGTYPDSVIRYIDTYILYNESFQYNTWRLMTDNTDIIEIHNFVNEKRYTKPAYTVRFSALSSSATMTRKETGETLTFASLAAAVASGSYHITAEASENWAGQQGNPITYYFNLETFKNNDGFSNNAIYFKGWKGSSTSHEFQVLDVGITYDTTIYEIAP